MPEMVSVYRRCGGSEANSRRRQNCWEICWCADLYDGRRFQSARSKLVVRVAQGSVEHSSRYRRVGRFGASALTALRGLRHAPAAGRLWRVLLAALARRR